MPKLAIYVPKKEMKVVEKWRKRLNFSQIFMRALQQEIAQRSNSAADDPLSAAAAFYAASTPADLVRNAGRQRARDHLVHCQLPRENLQRLLPLSQLSEVTTRQLETTLKLAGEEAQRAKLLKQHGFQASQVVEGERLFAEGYLTGIRETWAAISEHGTTSDLQV